MNDYKIETLYKDNEYLNLMETTYQDGKKWTYAKRVNSKGVVIIVPLILDLDEPSTLFLKTKRPPLLAEEISEYNIEFPAGLVGDENKNENFIQAIKKELLEEAGMVASEFIIKSNKLTSSAGCVSEVSTLAIAKITNSKIISNPVSDNGVIQKRIIVPVNEIKDFLIKQEKENCSIGAQTLAGVYYLMDELFHF